MSYEPGSQSPGCCVCHERGKPCFALAQYDNYKSIIGTIYICKDCINKVDDIHTQVTIKRKPEQEQCCDLEDMFNLPSSEQGE